LVGGGWMVYVSPLSVVLQLLRGENSALAEAHAIHKVIWTGAWTNVFLRCPSSKVPNSTSPPHWHTYCRLYYIAAILHVGL